MSSAFRLPALSSSSPSDFGLSFDVKKFFFDRVLVKNAVGAGTAKSLGKIGGTIRKIARQSQRFNKKGTPSPAGTPPRYHTKDEVATLRNILYALELSGQLVVVGIVRLRSFGQNPVPAIHELGLQSTIREKLVGHNWVPFGGKNARPGQPTRRRVVQYDKRPTMALALEKHLPKIPQEFKGMLNG